jgi:hypothetical protein
MHSEWMKVMLAEIERKQAQARDDRVEEQARATERQGAEAPDAGGEKKRLRKRR